MAGERRHGRGSDPRGQADGATVAAVSLEISRQTTCRSRVGVVSLKGAPSIEVTLPEIAGRGYAQGPELHARG